MNVFKIILFLSLTCVTAFAKVSCEKEYFCGTSTISENEAKKSLIQSIYSEIDYEFLHEKNNSNERIQYNLNFKNESPIFDTEKQIIDNVIVLKIKKDTYLKNLKESILELESKISRNKIKDSKSYNKYKHYLKIYNIYSDEKLTLSPDAVTSLKFYVSSDDKELKNYLINIFNSKGMKEDVNADILIRTVNKSESKVLGYGKIQYSLSYDVYVKNLINKKQDFFELKDIFFAKNENDISEQKKKYFINLIKGI